MPVTDSPLRYPGGKTKIYPKVKQIIDSTLNKENRIYIEPYAGGAGLALKLLYKGDVDVIILNDLDYHIYCFWISCLLHSDDLCKKIDGSEIDLCEWKKQRNIYTNAYEYTQLEVGFATFFLNRCNVSGIIEGGPIGGIEQKGKDGINARFNKHKLINKIRKISEYRDKIEFYNLDAIDFIQNFVSIMDSTNVLLNIDPPYVKKGPMLYKNAYNLSDHMNIAEEVAKLDKKWIVTYDECELVKNLYKDFEMETMTLNYSAGNTKSGNELIIYSNKIKVEKTYDRKNRNS